MPPVDVIERIKHEIAKFGAVGLAAYIIDVGIFNFLRFTEGSGVLADKPLTAKVISASIATTFAYFANRHWTFSHRQKTTFQREYVLFFLLNAVGTGISLLCLWLSHYVFNLTTPLADNISANGIGLILGTAFRFWSYRKWVFLEHSDQSTVVD